MSRWLSMTFCGILMAAIASNALAKRIAPKPVDPVVANGVKYVAPNDSGRKGIVTALDEKTGKKLWDVVIYTVAIDPKVEEDVQWVFITRLELKGDTLRVTNEKNEAYDLDLKTRKVNKLP